MNKKRSIRLDSEDEFKFDTVQAVLDFYRIGFEKRIEISKKLISKRQLVQFKKVSGIDYDCLANIIGITVRMIHKMKDENLFSRRISDNFASLVQLYSFGYYEFENPVLFNKWMKIGSPELEYISPLSNCDTIVGREEVRENIIQLRREQKNKSIS
ncbi:hypothetical protein [Chitinophaga sp. YIM B06452]|uniref:hypothetical protein n=1 Tax=Chitinophaga sp. YIM B06452 TaxID=3082158 RepID=UPI0031FF2F42